MKRYGSELPRIFTPPLRELTPDTSAGFSVIAFADELLEIKLYPWELWLLIHMLELLPDGSFRFRYVLVLVARQNGKSLISQIVALWFMYVFGAMVVLGTAQDLDVAEEIWQGAVDMVDETPELAEFKERVSLVNGKKFLELKGGQRYKVKAANRRAGRGLTGDLILLDELREHQSFDSWSAITKTTMARALAMILALSNAGDSSSIVLRHLRKMAHLALGDPDGINAKGLRPDEDVPEDEDIVDDEDSLAIFEWSAAPGCDTGDRDGWAQANPSLGYSITERTIASAQKIDPEPVFRTEVLCQWVESLVLGPFEPGSWDACRDDRSAIADGSPLAVGIDVSWDRGMAFIALAGRRVDGDLHVEVVAQRAGTDWVTPWLTERAPVRDFAAVCIQSNGAPVSSLKDDLVDAGLPVTDWAGPDLGRACGALWDLVRAPRPGEVKPRLWHLPQPVLDVAAAQTRTKPLGDSWVFDRRGSHMAGSVDCSPLIAVAAAVFALSRLVVPVRSKYEDSGLVTV